MSAEWKTVKLGEVADCALGKMLDARKNRGTPRQYLANVDVRWGRFDLTRLQTMKMEDGELAKYALRSGDLVVCEGGEPGRCAIWQDDTREMYIQKALIRVRARETLDIWYLYFWLRYYAKRGGLVQYQTGTGIKHMPLQKLVSIEISLPPLPLQRRIAGILSDYDAAIANCRRQIALLEEAAMRLYREWFKEGKGEKKRLGEIADITMGQSPSSDSYNRNKEGLPFHQGVTGFGVRFPTNEMWCKAGTRFANEGDILFSVRAPVGRINIAKEKIVIGRGLSAMREKRGFQSWLLYALKGYFTQEDMIGSGCIFSSTTKNELFDVRLPFAEEKEIHEFDAMMRPIDAALAGLDSQIRSLAEARDRLLPRLMAGEALDSRGSRGSRTSSLEALGSRGSRGSRTSSLEALGSRGSRSSSLEALGSRTSSEEERHHR